MNGSNSMVKNLIKELFNEGEDIQRASQKNLIDCVVCPPFVYLQQVAELLNQKKDSFLQLGAQNVYCESEGAYTGETSASMLQDVGCRYVIIGHSERRQIFGEENDLIARKFIKAYDTRLIPVLCVGETREERESGSTFDIVRQQLQAVMDLAPIQYFERAIIAYEPVWAIGTGLTATPEQAEEVHGYIRGLVTEYHDIASQVRILYGGSVKANNAADLFSKPNIDGGLIGGASLNSKEFLSICRAALVGV